MPEERPHLWTKTEISDRLDDTAEAWCTWSGLHQSYDGPWVDLVHMSGRVLYALTYYPTGRHSGGSDDIAPRMNAAWAMAEAERRGTGT
jgi:hypothetical protein